VQHFDVRPADARLVAEDEHVVRPRNRLVELAKRDLVRALDDDGLHGRQH